MPTITKIIKDWNNSYFKEARDYSKVFQTEDFLDFFKGEIYPKFYDSYERALDLYSRFQKKEIAKDDLERELKTILQNLIFSYDKLKKIVYSEEIEKEFHETKKDCKDIIKSISEYGELFGRVNFPIFSDEQMSDYVNKIHEINIKPSSKWSKNSSLKQIQNNLEQKIRNKESKNTFTELNFFKSLNTLFGKINWIIFLISLLGLFLIWLNSFLNFNFLNIFKQNLNLFQAGLLASFIFGFSRILIGRSEKSIFTQTISPLAISGTLILFKFYPEILTVETSTLKFVSELFASFVAIFWIPQIFINKFKFSFKKLDTDFITTLFFAVLSLVISYSVFSWQFWLVLIFAFVVPFNQLLLLSQRKIEWLGNNSRIKLFLPNLIGFGVISIFSYFFNFNEKTTFIWGIAFVIWLGLSLYSYLSYKFFRPTYDLIANFDGKNLTNWKHNIIFISYLSIIGISYWLGFNGVSSEIFKFSSSLFEVSLTLVGFVLALQGVLNTYAFRSRQDDEVGKFIEQRIILQMVSGLSGFIIIFLVLGLFSTLQNFLVKIPENGNIDPQTWEILLPITTISILIYSISTLIYMFLAGNLLSAPLKNFQLQKLSISILKKSDDKKSEEVKKEIENTILDLIQAGKIKTTTPLEVTYNNWEDDQILIVKLKTIAPDKKDLIEESLNIADKFIRIDLGLGKIKEIQIWVVSNTSIIKDHKIFNIKLNKETLEFMKNDYSKQGLKNLETKMSQIDGYFFYSPEFKEAQIF